LTWARAGKGNFKKPPAGKKLYLLAGSDCLGSAQDVVDDSMPAHQSRASPRLQHRRGSATSREPADWVHRTAFPRLVVIGVRHPCMQPQAALLGAKVELNADDALLWPKPRPVGRRTCPPHTTLVWGNTLGLLRKPLPASQDADMQKCEHDCQSKAKRNEPKAKRSQAEPSRAKPSQAKPSQAKPSQAKYSPPETSVITMAQAGQNLHDLRYYRCKNNLCRSQTSHRYK
jgi:hypothetical protein